MRLHGILLCNPCDFCNPCSHVNGPLSWIWDYSFPNESLVTNQTCFVDVIWWENQRCSLKKVPCFSSVWPWKSGATRRFFSHFFYRNWFENKKKNLKIMRIYQNITGNSHHFFISIFIVVHAFEEKPRYIFLLSSDYE